MAEISYGYNNAEKSSSRGLSVGEWILHASHSSLFRLLATVGMFGVIFLSVDMERLFDSYRNIMPALLLLGLMFQVLSTILAAYRWYLVMPSLGYRLRFGFCLRSYFKGAFFNQGLPTSIGGDALRVLDVARLGERKREAFVGVVIDRILGLVGLLLLNLFINMLNPALLPPGLFIAINTLIGLGLAGFVILLLLRHRERLTRSPVNRFFTEVSRYTGYVLSGPGRSAIQILLSVVVHLLSLLAIFFIGLSVDLNFSLSTYLVLVPPAILLTLIPLSLAGWGIREGALIGLFSLVGADQVTVLAMSILYGLVLIAASLPGMVVFLRGEHRLTEASG